MKTFIYTIAVAAMCSALLTSCDKKPLPNPVGGPDPSGLSKVKLEFANKVGTANLTLGSQWYKNDFGDSFKVNAFNYYITNIKLNSEKTPYTEANSYHLIKHGVDSTMSFDLEGVPYGTYSSMTVMIGVDSARNVSGAQTGALDPLHEMFWSWSTGYIMLKLEGVSPQSTGVDNLVIFHIGGHSGQWAGQRTVTIPFPNAITVGKDGENHVHIDADVNVLFKSPVSMMNIIMSIGKESQVIANGYADMLSISYSGL